MSFPNLWSISKIHFVFQLSQNLRVWLILVVNYCLELPFRVRPSMEAAILPVKVVLKSHLSNLVLFLSERLALVLAVTDPIYYLCLILR